MVLRLQPYEVKLHYSPGEGNHAADLLSRFSDYMEIGPTSSFNDKNVELVSAHGVNTRRRKYPKRLKGEYEVEHILARVK